MTDRKFLETIADRIKTVRETQRPADTLFAIERDMRAYLNSSTDSAADWLATYCENNYGGAEGQDGKGFTAADMADARAASTGTFTGVTDWVDSYCERNYSGAEGQDGAGFTADDMRLAYESGKEVAV